MENLTTEERNELKSQYDSITKQRIENGKLFSTSTSDEFTQWLISEDKRMGQLISEISQKLRGY